MRAKLTASVKALANGAASDEDRPLLQGVYITEKEAVVADGFLLVIKVLQPQEMQLEKVADDGIREVNIPANALKACKGDEVMLQTIEVMRHIPSAELLRADATVTTTKVVARLDGADFSVEADAIEGEYPRYVKLFAPSPLVGQVAVSTKVLKKLLRTLPDDSFMQLRISLPDKPIEFQCQDEDGDLPIRGMIMPMNVMWEHTKWKTKDQPAERNRMTAISWAMRMMAHPKASQEFSLACQAILPIMRDPLELVLAKRKTLNMMVNELSENTFKLKPVAEQIMTIINMKVDVCREYPDSEAQTAGILGWLPRMKEHRDMLLAEVKKHRKSYGLKI